MQFVPYVSKGTRDIYVVEITIPPGRTIRLCRWQIFPTNTVKIPLWYEVAQRAGVGFYFRSTKTPPNRAVV